MSPGRPADAAWLAAVVGLPLHEGVRAGGGGASAVAPLVPGVPLATALRTPLDELCPGDRADVPRRRRGLRRALPRPERQTLVQLQQSVEWYKNETLEKVGFYRMALRFGHVPRPIRRLLWWSTLNVSGYKRCKRFGTFGLSSYGALGAEQVHPISPLTTTLTYGPIDPATRQVVVKLIYDHRVLDGAYVARRLRDIEETLNGPILEELRGGPATMAGGPTGRIPRPSRC